MASSSSYLMLSATENVEEKHKFDLLQCCEARRARVLAPFLAEAERSAVDRLAEACPPIFPPLCAGAEFMGFPLPEPLFLPPPVIAFTVDQARRSASSSETPRFS